jgi:methylmalonyl-CoA mutase
VLIDESNLARVIDPAGGSWYVESLTNDLAAAAWSFFQELEARGGIAAALESGFVDEQLAITRTARDARIARRQDAFIGVSEFPLLDETPVVRPSAPASTNGGGLPRIRYVEPYEALRDRSDDYLAQTGHRPSVFLAGLGSTRDRSARVSFASGAVAPGGFETTTSTGTDIEAVGREFAEHASSVAILCSSDAIYAEQAADAAATLKKHGARLVLLAGRPGDREAEYRAAGVDGFVAAGSDIIAALHQVYDALEVR